MKMEERECSETLAYKIHMPGNYPEETIQQSEHGESCCTRCGPDEESILDVVPRRDGARNSG